MQSNTPEMVELDDRDRDVLEVLDEGRANPLLIRDQTGLEKGDVNTVLVRLGRAGYTHQLTRGLYELTEKGSEELRELRAERENWVLHDPVTESDLERFPKKAKQADQNKDHLKWLLLGVSENERAYYFDRTDQTVREVTREEEGLSELDLIPLEDIAHGESFADRMLNYILSRKKSAEWDRWSEYSLALSFAESMRTVAPKFLTNQERIGYAFRIAFDIPFDDAMPFLGVSSATTDEFSNLALEKLEQSAELGDWLQQFGLPKPATNPNSSLR